MEVIAYGELYLCIFFFELKVTQLVRTVRSLAFLSDEWSYTFLDIRGYCYQDSSGVVDGVGGFGCGPVD